MTVTITVIDTGAAPGDGTGDPARTAFTSINSNEANIKAAIEEIQDGKQTIWVPAAAMRPTVSNGCADITDVETTAASIDMQVLDFDTAADEHAQFQVAFPKRWNLGTVTFQAFWTTTNASTNTCAWALQGVAVSDADTIDTAWSGGTPVAVVDTAQTAAEDLYVADESGAVTIGGTPADNDICYFRVFRDVSADNMTEDGRLIGIKLFFTTDAGTDT